MWVLNLVTNIAGGRRLSVSENMVFRRIIGPRRDEGGMEEIA